MTLVNIVLKNVAGEYGPDDCVVFHAPQHREGIGGQTINTAPKTVALVDGVGSVELDPGPVTVTLRTKGWEDTAPKTVNVPETGPVTLTGLLLDAFEWSPVIVSQVRTLADRAESAADRAEDVADTFGSLEGVAVEVQAAKDAATSAAGSATTAEGHATAAGASATAADASKVSAAGSATAAAQSAVNAANSEWVAGEHKGVAEAAAAEAAASRDAAGLSSMSAADHAVAADGARVGAESARDAAAGSASAAELSAGDASTQADRSQSEADRAEAAAQSAATGVQADTVGRVHLTPELRGELDEKVTVEHRHTWDQVDDKPTTFPPTTGTTPDTAAPGDHTHTAAEVGAAPADHSHPEYATTDQVNARTPEVRVVSSADQATAPGVLYIVTGA